MPRPGPVYDDAMKILADDDLSAVLSIVGVHGDAEPLTIELPGSTTRADLLARTPTAAVAALAAGSSTERAAALRAAVELIAAGTTPDRRKLLLGAATTLASITLPAATIDAALKEAHMPVPIRETPLGRLLLDEGRVEGRQEGERAAVVRLTRLMLRQRFGDDPRIDAVAANLANLPDDERLGRLADAVDMDSLAG